ncbi:MAG: endonuclease/exonuclease/phosphatase family protein [Candidatus Marinimicrobia bacterium]|nr:endonuclease/exonuclease/phosphatase family protein [Candidatus Neomarinimicrobiota bacterium]RKY59451.1 MAG: hypothetical protein DRP96_06985 [Candidatus Neomarinimicrobiota bacterium]
MKKLVLLILFAAVVFAGYYVLRKNPEDQLKKIVYPSEFRIMTYNIHHGVGTDDLYSLSRIARIIRDYSPHVVCLNEVDNQTERTYHDDQARILAAELGMEFTFGRNLSLQGGWYGNAILSKFPIYFAENKILSNRDDQEPRGMLHAILMVNDKKLHIYTTHLSTDSLGSSAEMTAMLNHVLDWGLDEPVIIAGDMNLLPNTKPISEITYYFEDVGSRTDPEQLTYPSLNPARRIDYIFINDRLAPVTIQTVNNDYTRDASDHLPVLVRFRFK